MIEHTWVCSESKKLIKEEWVREVEKAGLVKTEESLTTKLWEIIRRFYR